MSDLISRQAAINAIEPTLKSILQGNSFKAINVMDKIRALPSAQAEWKKGKWIHHPEIGYGETWLCSECGEKTTSSIMGEPRYVFCPMCGARMED